MPVKKNRIRIPVALAGRVQFEADRTCCVCRKRGKPIQIHHIDEDPSNNVASNLAVLCLDCHNETQISGGFGRQLDESQVRLYRDDWNHIVAVQRQSDYREEASAIEAASSKAAYFADLIDRLREAGDFVTLASVYNDLELYESRDKYIDRAIEQDGSDWAIIHLRALQGRQDLIPEEVASNRLDNQADRSDWTQRARTLMELSRPYEAADNYVRGILESLEKGNAFSAAYYLREIHSEDLVKSLFEIALQQATDRGELWWQIRSMQELGWRDELDEFMRQHEDEVRAAGNILMLPLLADSMGDEEEGARLRRELFNSRVRVGEYVAYKIDEPEESGPTEMSGGGGAETHVARESHD